MNDLHPIVIEGSRVTVTTLVRVDGNRVDLKRLATATEPHLDRIFAKAHGTAFRYYVSPRTHSLKIGLEFDSTSPDGDWQQATDASLEAAQEALNELGADDASAHIWSRGLAGL